MSTDMLRRLINCRFIIIIIIIIIIIMSDFSEIILDGHYQYVMEKCNCSATFELRVFYHTVQHAFNVF